MDEKNMIPESQTGFRKRMGVINSIYVLNYLVIRKVNNKGSKVVAAFIDLKAAFDSVNREMLMETMKNRGIRKGLRSRIEEVYRETRSKVRVGKEERESFWTKKERREGDGEKRGRGEEVYERWEQKDREMQKKERWERIRESRYNRWYGEWKEEGLPKYLRKEWRESRWKKIVRFRMTMK
ncbi:CWF19-like protein 2 [Nylanderia fulva]|uniref:CWF19-like protein 2 n=1 Tax=Nylanderia fulva TaxID=613905 RepID=UPI0010FBA729|nr:CWF19-like protein 2 [Nylanderia fulva]